MSPFIYGAQAVISVTMTAKIYDAEMHYLTVAYAKDVGLTRRGLVVAWDSWQASREEAELEPLLVYSLVSPAYGQRFRLLVDPLEPVALSKFLSSTWSARAELGLPLTLEVKSSLLRADHGFGQWVVSHGVALREATAIKSINAFERTAHDLQHALTWPIGPGVGFGILPRSLDDCNTALHHHDRLHFHVMDRTSMVQYTYRAWQAQEKRYCSLAPLEHDWDAAQIVERPLHQPRPGLALRDGERPISVEGIRDLVAMWPGAASGFLADTGLRKRDFDAWASGRSHLSLDELDSILDRANVQGAEDGGWELGGGYLLKATSPMQVRRLYDVLSRGGYLSFAFELLGPDGEVPPMRFVVFEACDRLTNVLLFERGGVTERLIDERYLMGLPNAVHTPRAVWDTVLSIIAKSGEMTQPGDVGRTFYIEHGQWLVATAFRLRPLHGRRP